MSFVLLGAGGHARVVYEIAIQLGVNVRGFVDPLVTSFEELPKLSEDFYPQVIMGIGGVRPEQLEKRHTLYIKYLQKQVLFLSMISCKAIVSKTAKIGTGTIVGNGSIIQAGACLGENVIINTGVIIEHGAVISDGSHIAPGAIILGDVTIGKFCLIGAGAVILPGATIPDRMLVPALTRYREEKNESR